MMQTRLRAAFAAVLLAATASASVALADTKIAIIRFDDAVRASPQYKTADKKMTDEFQKRKSDLENQGKTFDDDVKKYQRDRATMSPDQQAKTEKDLAARQVDLNQAGRKFQEDAAARQRDLTNEVVGKVRDAIVAVAKDKQLDVVIADPIFANNSLDITDEVLKRLAAGGGK